MCSGAPNWDVLVANWMELVTNKRPGTTHCQSGAQHGTTLARNPTLLVAITIFVAVAITIVVVPITIVVVAINIIGLDLIMKLNNQNALLTAYLPLVAFKTIIEDTQKLSSPSTTLLLSLPQLPLLIQTKPWKLCPWSSRNGKSGQQGYWGQTTKQTQKNKLIIERELLLQESLTLGVDVDFVADSEVVV